MTLLLTLALTLPLPAQDAGIDPIMAGIGNGGQNPDRPYVTACDRAYLIGTQDGDFPDLGQHVPGEMGGLWLHPIKLLDGFWATITDLDAGREAALPPTAELVTYPYGSRFRYRRSWTVSRSSVFSSVQTATTVSSSSTSSGIPPRGTGDCAFSSPPGRG